MYQLYTICFWVGLILPVLSLILSGILGLFDVTMDFFDGSFNGSADVGFHGFLGNVLSFLPTSPLSVLIFLLLFGGVGRLCIDRVEYHLPVAILCGWVASVAVNRFILRPLRQKKAESVNCESFVGKTGILSQSIMENGYGMVRFESEVGTSSFIALSPVPIKQGTKVVVKSCDKGKLHVEPLTQENCMQ